jgi:hypothetical protein
MARRCSHRTAKERVTGFSTYVSREPKCHSHQSTVVPRGFNRYDFMSVKDTCSVSHTSGTRVVAEEREVR